MGKAKSAIKKTIKKFLRILPLKNYIVFESRPDLSDNTKAVFDEMVRRGLNKKYKLIWFCYDKNKIDYPKTKNVKLLYKQGWIQSYYLARAKILICCNRFLIPITDRQFSIYLGHGNPLKNTKGYYIIPDTIEYILASSEGVRQIRNNFYGYNLAKMIPLGYPRNDVLTETSIDLHKYFSVDYKKIIVWYPTFRQTDSGNKYGADKALQIIWDEQKASELNGYAKNKGILIVLKPHFAQDVSCIKKLDLSNIVFIDDTFFKQNDITSYRFVGSCDALLTDFSSIYYDYTLCDKPIGLIWEDYEEYKQNPGFAVDMDYMMKGGEKIYNLDDLKAFISDIANDVDRLKEVRREIRDFTNYSTDGKNAERVVDFIIEKAKI